MGQIFHTQKVASETCKNGAVVYGSGGDWNAAPYAKVVNCPIAGTSLRLTCYQTSLHPGDAFSVAACTRYKGAHIGGFFTGTETGIMFRPYDRFKYLLPRS